MTWLGVYHSATPFTKVGADATVRLDAENEPQPDGLLLILGEAGGHSTIDAGYVSGSPELIAEIVASSAAYDLHDKKEAYRRGGVVEYLVWLVYEERLDWFVLNEGKYELLQASPGGMSKSPTLPGLWLDADALLAGNLSKVLGALQEGLDSEEHQNFVAMLTARTEKPEQ
jgi:Uma2 family endonuclease